MKNFFIKKFLLYWLPVIVWAGAIFFLSSIPDLKSGLKEDFLLRKIAHILEFAVLTFLLFRAIFLDRPFATSIIYSLIIALFYAFSDELHQLFVFGREGNIRDVAIDSIGILIVICLCYIKNRK